LLGAGPPSSCSGNQQRRHRRGAVEVGTAFAHHAYRLFLERARERRPGLVPDADTEAAVLNICGQG
jgi:predicted ATPase